MQTTTPDPQQGNRALSIADAAKALTLSEAHDLAHDRKRTNPICESQRKVTGHPPRRDRPHFDRRRGGSVIDVAYKHEPRHW